MAINWCKNGVKPADNAAATATMAVKKAADNAGDLPSVMAKMAIEKAGKTPGVTVEIGVRTETKIVSKMAVPRVRRNYGINSSEVRGFERGAIGLARKDTSQRIGNNGGGRAAEGAVEGRRKGGGSKSSGGKRKNYVGGGSGRRGRCGRAHTVHRYRHR